jgi:hypothetical protein
MGLNCFACKNWPNTIENINTLKIIQTKNNMTDLKNKMP